MNDTTHMAYTAEDYIAYKLQEAGFLVAKPKFDRDGTDLIIMLSVDPGTKFGKVQSKGRSLTNSSKTNITIPCAYVDGPFFLFVYINHKLGEDLYLFFADDIKKWRVSNGQYVKYISRENIDSGSLRGFLFQNEKAGRIAEIIKRTTSELEKDMFRLLRMGTELIEKQKKARDLGELVHNIQMLNKEEESAKRDLSEAYSKIRSLAKEIVETAPTRIIDIIQNFKKDGHHEEKVFSELSNDSSIDLDKEVVWLIILYLYDSIEQKY